MDQPMQIATRHRADILVVELAGRLDSYAAEACDRLVALGRDGGALRVVLDLARLDYINSSGLTAIMVTARHLRARGGELVIAAPRGTPAMALETAGFDTLLRIVPSEREALAVLAAA